MINEREEWSAWFTESTKTLPLDTATWLTVPLTSATSTRTVFGLVYPIFPQFRLTVKKNYRIIQPELFFNIPALKIF